MEVSKQRAVLCNEVLLKPRRKSRPAPINQAAAAKEQM